MKYEKPELVQFGAAIDAVHSSTNKGTKVQDNLDYLATSAAYEADE